MDNNKKVWGYLRETQEQANMAKEQNKENNYTAMEEYLKVIFPDVTDWLHGKAIGKVYGKSYRIRPDFRSESLKLIVEFDGLPHYTRPAIIEKDKQNTAIYESLGYKVVRIPYFIQLTNEVVKQMFGVDVDEVLFDPSIPSLTGDGYHTPAYLSPAGLHRMAVEFMKYPQQLEVNLAHPEASVQ